MKRILHSLKTGVTEITETPCPQNKPGHVLIKTNCSLISPGTEKMLIDFGKASLLDKVRQQPDKVRMVIDKIKTDGLFSTWEAVSSKLDQLLPLGYCNVGTVIAVGEGVETFAIGDRVVSNGAHAEIVSVPKNLCCKIPDEIPDDAAVFTVLGAIALQSMRLANPLLGETFVVVGLGLIGLLTIQLLCANGCRVLGIDFDVQKLKLAAQFGATTINLSAGEDPIAIAHTFSRQRGVDGVILALSSASHEPIHQAAKMCRKRGRIILVGVTGLTLSRADFYEKELSFQVSCSYGPGRYDAHYEEKGHDYPIGFVRWTEQRNFEAFLDMVAQQRLMLAPLISQRFSFAAANQAYALLAANKNNLGILLEYDAHVAYKETMALSFPIASSSPTKKVCIGMIGAGNYASRILIPAFKKADVICKTIACRDGISGMQIGKKFGFEKVTTQIDDIFSDPDINTVVIATRHHHHAQCVLQALQAGKHIFVEKPLCLTMKELDMINHHLPNHAAKQLMIGFNRRFSPLIQKIKKLLAPIQEPKSFIMTINAGAIPATHWTQQRDIGGGRIIGEACHFIDLLRFLAGAAMTDFHITNMQHTPISDDKVAITLSFADGSFGTIHYLANGNKAVAKERLEIFVAGKILQLDNFYKLRGYGWKNFKKMHLWRQDKGQIVCVQQFVDAITQGLPPLIPLDEIIEVSKVTLELAHTVKSTVPHATAYSINHI